jgi:hypothetical protein
MSHSQLQTGFTGQNVVANTVNPPDIPSCGNYLNTAWIKKNGGTTAKLTDTNLKDGTVTVAIHDDMGYCLRDVQNALSYLAVNFWATGLNTDVNKAAFEAAQSYTDGMVVATSFTFPKSVSNGTEACKQDVAGPPAVTGIDKVTVGLCLW